MAGTESPTTARPATPTFIAPTSLVMRTPRFIKVGKGVHYVEEAENVLEKATGLTHKGVGWLVDVLPVRA